MPLSVSPRPLGFVFGTKGFGAKGLGPGLDDFYSKIINKMGRELMATILTSTPLTNVCRLETNDEVKW